MRNGWESLAARALSILLVLTMMVQFLPSAAAANPVPPKIADAGDTDVTGQPLLSVDFLGDYAPGVGFDGPTRTEAPNDAEDWYYKSEAAEGTIFWVGVGIDKMDKFALKDGVFSLEAGFYYNSKYIEPYTGLADTATPDEKDAAYLGVLKTYNEGLWGTNYEVITAFTGLSPQMNDATQEAISGPSNTEIMADSNWKMTNIAIEKKESQVGKVQNRFSGTSETKTQYIAYIPFVLKEYDATQALCLRLIRNATHFTMASGAGGYETLGAWERDTTRLPEIDLKLMVRFGGDLNIFKAPKVPDPAYSATLNINNAGVAQNNGTLSISNDQSPNPIKVRGDGAVLKGLTEGTGMELELACRNGFEATVAVTDSKGEVTVTTVTADKKYTFTMPGDNVTVKIEFKPKTTGDIAYELTLAQKGTPEGVVGNKAWMTSDQGSSDPTTVGSQTLSATQSTPVTIHAECRIDYLAKVTVKDISNNPVGISSTSPGATSESDSDGIMTMTLPTGGTVTFTMPGSDVLVDVVYVKAPTFKGNLSVVYDTSVAEEKKSEKDLAQLSYPVQANNNTPGTGYSGIVGHAAITEGAEGVLGKADSGVTGNKDLFSTVQKGQTVTVTLARDPNHQIQSVVVSRKEQPAAPAEPTPDQTLTPTTVTGKEDFFTATFIQPDYEVNVTVTYELRPLRTLTLDLSGGGSVAANTAKATGTGEDGKTVTTDLGASTPDKSIQVFEKTEVVIVIEKDSNFSINSIKLIDGDGKNHLTSSMVTTAPNGTKTVKFKMPTADIKAEIRYLEGKDPEYTATLGIAYATGSTPGANSAAWAGGGAEVTSAAGAHHSATATVAPGYYIQSVAARGADGTAYPVTADGNGYNNNAGGTVALGMDMPAENVTVTVTLALGIPPLEPAFEASLKVLDPDNTEESPADNHAKLSFVDALGSTVSGNVVRKDGSDTLGGIRAGDLVTLDFAAAGDYYVTDIVVTPASLNVAVEWEGLNQATFVMPAGDVSVAVVFRSGTVVPPVDSAHDLTVGWEVTASTGAPSADNKVTEVDTTKLLKNTAITLNPQTIAKLTIPGDTVTMKLQVAANFRVSHVTVVGGGVQVPVAIPADAQELATTPREVEVTFVMPDAPVKATVIFSDTPGDGGETGEDFLAGLTVQDDDNGAGANNWAQLSIGGRATAQVKKDGSAALYGVKAGDTAKITWNTDTDYVLDVVLVTPAGLGIVPTMTGPNSAEFIMPAGDVTVLVRFRAAVTAPLYTANLVIRGVPEGVALDDVGSAGFSGLGAPSVYSITAPAGKAIGVDIFAKAGYYIEGFEVTPANLKVSASLTGIFAAQSGSFTMPAANCTVNVTFGGGWPDSVAYNAVLWVTDPNLEPNNFAAMKNLTTDRAQTSPDVTGGKLALITGREGDVMELTFHAQVGYEAEIFLKDSTGKTVPYVWTAERTVSFCMPPNHVSAEVRYQKGAPTLYDVALFVDGTADDTAKLDATYEGGGGTLGPIAGGDSGTLSNVKAGNKIILEAVASAGRYVKAAMVMAGGEMLALQMTRSTDITLRGEFTMPKQAVKVYVYFAEGTPPAGELAEYAAALTVTEPGGSAPGDAGQAKIQTVEPPVAADMTVAVAAPLVAGPSAVAKSNDAPVYISVTKENRIQVAAMPQGSFKVEDIRLTPIGSSLSFSVKFDWLNDKTVEFAMPEQPVAVEVLMSPAEPTYSAQLLVNDEAYTGGAGTSKNAAEISDGTISVIQGQRLENLRLGAPIEVNLTIGAGYAAEVSVMTDSGSSTPLSVDADAATQTAGFGMPAGNVIVYVKFVRVADVNYSATLRITSDKITTQANVALTATLADGTKETVNTSGASIGNLVGKEALAVAVTMDAGNDNHKNTKVAAVLMTTKTGTTYVTPVEEIYTGSMPKEDVVVTVVLVEKNSNLYVAAMNKAGDDGKVGNSLTSIKNLTSIDLPGESKGWTAAHIKDVVEVAFTTEPGYYATVKAVSKTDGTELTVLQQGVTLSGKARFAMPADDVQVTVTYSNKAPTETYPIDLVFSGHAQIADNKVVLKSKETSTPAELASLAGGGGTDADLRVTVSAVVLGTSLGLDAIMSANYRVKSAVLSAGTGDSFISMDVPLTAVDASTSAGGFYMPSADATLTVTYKSGYSATLVMADNSAGKTGTATLAATDKASITVSDTKKTDTMDQLLTGVETTTTYTAGTAVLRGVLLTKGSGTTFMPEDGVAVGAHPYTIESEDVTVTTVFDDSTGTSYIAAVELAGAFDQVGNGAAIVNTTAETEKTKVQKGDIWTMATKGDTLTVTVALAEGYVAKLTAVTQTDMAVPVTPVAVGSDGSVSTFAMPARENVLVTVTFEEGDPTPRPYDPEHGADATKGYTAGWLQAVNNNDGESLTVTVPVLGAETKAADGTVELKLQSVYVAPATEPLVKEFEVAYTFYLESADEPGTYVRLKAGTDYTISVPPTRTDDYVFDGVTYTSEQFTFTALTEDMKKLVAGGGTLHVTTISKDLDTPLPESYRTALDVPEISLWAKPHDPERTEAAVLGTIGSVNNGGVITVAIPTLMDAKDDLGSVPDEVATDVATGTRTEFRFNFYLNNKPDEAFDEANCIELIWGDTDDAKNNIEVLPVDPDQTGGNYTYGPSFTPPDGSEAFTGVRFYLKATDPDSPIGKILANLGSEQSGHALYVRAVAKITETGSATPITRESEFVPLIVPRYYTLKGELTSYAPTHEAKLSVYRYSGAGPGEELDSTKYEPDATVTTRVASVPQADWTEGKSTQPFQFQSSLLLEEGETTATYMLVIEKDAHITYRRVNMELVKASAAGDNQEFVLVDTVTLIGGDANGDNLCKDNDRDTLMAYMMHNKKWSTEQNKENAEWTISVFNPDAPAYTCDLDGDGRISAADLNIQMAAENYNRSEDDYGAPSGLEFTPAVTTLDAEIELLPAEEPPPADEVAPVEPEPTPPEETLPALPLVPSQPLEKPPGKDENPPIKDSPAVLPDRPVTLPAQDWEKKEKEKENPLNSEKNGAI